MLCAEPLDGSRGRQISPRVADQVERGEEAERDRIGTEENLRAIGCGDYVMLICKADAAKETTEQFKTAARAKLEAGGHVIIANLGDQDSDLVGGHAEKIFKLPNPFYFTK